MIKNLKGKSGVVACFAMVVAAIWSCDNLDSLQPPVAVPDFQTVYADSINQNSARLNAVVSNQGMLTSFGFFIQADSSNQELPLKAEADNDTIRVWANNLKSQTKYRFWAKADNGGGISIFSDTAYFETLPAPPDTTLNPDNSKKPDTINKSLYIDFENENLRKWIVLRYDANGDGQIDTIEAKSINTIEINTDNISTLKGIERLHSLTKITAHGTRIGDSVCGKLEHIDLSGNPNLLELHVEHNVIKDIDFSHNTQLTFVELNLNSIAQIDVSMLKEVDLLSVEYNLISTFDCSGLDKLKELHVGHCPNLTSITLNNKVLESLDCADDEALTEIDISKCPLLNGVDFWGCKNLKRVIMSRDQAIGSIRTEPDSNIEFIYE